MGCNQTKDIYRLRRCQYCYEELIKKGIYRIAPRYDKNRERALKRDHYKCQLCRSGKGLHVHHIDGRDERYYNGESNHALDNLITLCAKCHKEIHVLMRKNGAR